MQITHVSSYVYVRTHIYIHCNPTCICSTTVRHLSIRMIHVRDTSRLECRTHQRGWQHDGCHADTNTGKEPYKASICIRVTMFGSSVASSGIAFSAIAASVIPSRASTSIPFRGLPSCRPKFADVINFSHLFGDICASSSNCVPRSTSARTASAT